MAVISKQMMLMTIDNSLSHYSIVIAVITSLFAIRSTITVVAVVIDFLASRVIARDKHCLYFVLEASCFIS
jgi:hypothetical protein